MKYALIQKRIVTILLIGSLWMPCAFAEEKAALQNSTQPAESATSKAPTPAVKVNDSVVPVDIFEIELELQRRRLMQQGQALTEELLAVLRSQVLDNLINQELLYQETVKEGILTKAEDVDSELAAIKTRFTDPGQYEAALANMKMTEADLRQQIAQRAAIRSLVETRIGVAVAVSEEEIRGFYDANPDYFNQPELVHARHILIRVTDDADLAAEARQLARKKIEEIKERLDKGEDFGELARTASEGPSNERGGDLGYFARGRMVKPFEDAVFALSPNQVSDIVETEFGYHLIQALDRKAAQTVPFEAVKERISSDLRNEKIQKGVEVFLEELRKTAQIERFIN